MASTYSTNLALELIGTGDQSGTWGTTNNTNLGTLVEQAVSGYQTQVITDGADTVITIPNGASGVARNMTLELTGALTAARNLIVPANKKLYFIYNNTTGGYAVTVKVSGQTGVSVPNGVKTLLVSNGTDVVSAVTYLANLTVGGNPTLSGGTANGVAYLNGSKALTTGSALTFNGSTLAVSATTGVTALALNNPTSGSGSENLQSWTNGTDSNLFIRLSQVGAASKFGVLETQTATSLILGTNSTARVQISSAGNVTINAPSSGYALTATAVGTSGAIKAVATTAGSNSFIASPGSATGVAYSFDTNGTVGMYQSAVNNIDFGVLGSSAININSTRNVTINAPSSGNTLTVTPVAGGNIGVDVNGNIGAGTAIRLFNTSATDGRSTIEFRSDLTSSKQWAIGLDAAGGTSKSFDFRDLTRSAIPLSIASAGNVTINAPSSGVALTSTSSGGSVNLRLTRDATNILDFYHGGGIQYIDASAAGSSLAFAIAGSVAARIDSSGNLGLGVTPSAYSTGWGKAVQVNRASLAGDINAGAYFSANWYYDGTNNKYIATNYATQMASYNGTFVWNIAGSGTAGTNISFTQAMALDSSGNLLVGTTDNTGVNTQGLEVYIGGGGTRLYIGHANGTANGTQYVVFNYAGTNQIGSISQNGTTAVLYNTTSDQRLKDNITDADSASDLIDAIKVRQFDWKADGSHQRYGMVAQELHEVAPEAVHVPADPDAMMAVDYSKLVPMLVKEIQSLRQRLAVLEAK